MLALSIVLLVIDFILNIAIGVNAGLKGGNNFYIATLVLALLAMGASVIPLVLGIKGIKDPFTRGKSIATTAIAGGAIIYGFAVAFIAAMIIVFGPDFLQYF